MPALLAALLACQGDTGFSTNQQDVQTDLGDPGLSYSPQEITFTDLEVGPSYSKPLSFQATGDADLVIYLVSVTGDSSMAFSVYGAEEDLRIAPGDSAEITVLATLSQAAPATAELLVQSNVSDMLEFTIPLSAWPADRQGAGDTGDTGP